MSQPWSSNRVKASLSPARFQEGVKAVAAGRQCGQVVVLGFGMDVALGGDAQPRAHGAGCGGGVAGQEFGRKTKAFKGVYRMFRALAQRL